MSLFNVSRYTGDGEESPRKKRKEASAILQKLQEEAIARRQSGAHTDKQTESTEGVIHDTPKDVSKTKAAGVETPSPKKLKKRERQPDGDADKTLSPKKLKKSKTDIDTAEDPANSDDALAGKLSANKDLVNEKISAVKQDKIRDVKKGKAAKLEKGKTVKSEKGKAVKSEKGKAVKSESKDDEMESDDGSDEEDDESSKDNDESDGDDEKSENDGSKIVDTGPGSQEIGGFTVIGNIKPTQAEKVMRKLPDWLSSPTMLSADLKADLMSVEQMPGLDPDLAQAVLKNGIKTFFPVQSQVIPALLNSSATGFLYGRAGYRPSDICVSAPTGSGKTLAFVLPIVQALKSRVSCEVRALAVLPVQNLAIQVFKVFEEYCKLTKLKVGCLTGNKPFAIEQKGLVKRTLRGYKTQYDIIVATPGRLVDHLNKTKGFQLGHLRYLVIDEADRMMDEIKQEWLMQTEAAVYRARLAPRSLTAASCTMPQTPVQKLLYSATLSQNPERLQPLNLFQPKLFISAATGITALDSEGKQPNADSNNSLCLSKDDLGKYSTPSELSEFIVETKAERKPLVVLHMLHQLGYRNILCFTNSVEAAHRLSSLIRLYGGVEVTELSSNFHVGRRNKVIQKFMAGSIDILICSDMVARGIDITNVKYVVSYDPPKFIKTHIHRIGRTARAGKEGVALTLLEDKECFHFKKILKQVGKKFPKKMVVTKKDLKPLLPTYQKALKELPAVLKVRPGETDKTKDIAPGDVPEKDQDNNDKRPSTGKTTHKVKKHKKQKQGKQKHADT